MTSAQAYDHFRAPPPQESAGLVKWRDRIKSGWRPNRRIRVMDPESKFEFFGVYAWEYFNVILPLLRG